MFVNLNMPFLFKDIHVVMIVCLENMNNSTMKQIRHYKFIYVWKNVHNNNHILTFLKDKIVHNV